MTTNVASVAARVSFPPSGALVTEPMVTLCGSTPNGADSLDVAGVAAVSDDGFLTWRADLNLQDGLNQLSIQVTVDGVAQTPTTHQLRLEPHLDLDLAASAIGLDGSLVYYSRGDFGDYSLTRVSADGSREYFPSVTAGPNAPKNRIAYDSTQGILTQVTTGSQSLSVTDITTGNLLGTYSLPDIPTAATGLVSEHSSGDVFVVTFSLSTIGEQHIYRFQPLTGTYTIVSGPWSTALGVSLSFLTHDKINNYLYAWSNQEKSVYRFDPSSGARVVLATGLPTMGTVVGMAANPAHSRLEFVNTVGERYALSTVQGPPVLMTRASCDPAYVNVPPASVAPLPPYTGIIGDGSGTIFLMRKDRSIRIAVDGSCREFLRAGRGAKAGMFSGGFRFMTWDSLRQRVVGNGDLELFAIDPKTGDIEELPKPSNGYLHPFARPIRYDASQDRIYYITAATTPGPGGVYSVPGAGGDETFEVPLPLGFAAKEVDYDPVSGEYLAIILLYGGPPTTFMARRIKSNGVTFAEYQITNSPVLSYLLLPVAASRLVVGYRLNPMEMVSLKLPNFALTSIMPFTIPTGVPFAMLHDPVRNEFLTLSNNTLTIVNLETGVHRATAIATGPGTQPHGFEGLTRDLETGMIYIGGRDGNLLMVEPLSLAKAFIHY